MSVPEEALMMAMAYGGVTTVLWIRAALARKRIENRLWGMAAAQGLPVGAMAEDAMLRAMPQRTTTDQARIEQVESQIDQVMHQLDRLAESQEFLSRMMTDRVGRLPEARMNTPH